MLLLFATPLGFAAALKLCSGDDACALGEEATSSGTDASGSDELF